jgi:hypothetical protein
MRVAPSLAVIAAQFACVVSTGAGVTRLASSDREALEQTKNVELVYTTGAIPTAVRDACATVISDHRFWMADAGKPFNVTDVGPDDRIPSRRLIWAARLPERFLLHYESGGIAHGFHLILVRFTGSSAHVVWRAATTDYKDYALFLQALKQNKPDDTFDNLF